MRTTIIVPHYPETENRNKIFQQVLEALQPYRTSETELIIANDGHGDPDVRHYCDMYIERSHDGKPGKSCNDAIKLAKGEIFAIVNDDIFVKPGWLDACLEIVTKYPKYLATPVIPSYSISRWELPSIDGCRVNYRAGSNCMVLTRRQYEDIGAYPEMNVVKDGTEFYKLSVRKGYAVMMTRIPLAQDLGLSGHSYV